MGHEYVGVVEQVGDDVHTVQVGDFVVGSLFASDNTCEICQAGYQSRCIHAVPMGAIGTQAELVRVPLADGTLVATPGPAGQRLQLLHVRILIRDVSGLDCTERVICRDD